MTDSNPYREFREQRMFEHTKGFAESLKSFVEKYYPEIAEKWFDDKEVFGVLSDFSWSSLERRGSHTKGDTIYVPYKFERQGLRIFVSARLDEETCDVKEHVYFTVTLGHDMDKSVQSSENYDVCHFSIKPTGKIVPESL